jgi:flagellar motor switch protein FliG
MITVSGIVGHMTVDLTQIPTEALESELERRRQQVRRRVGRGLHERIAAAIIETLGAAAQPLTLRQIVRSVEGKQEHIITVVRDLTTTGTITTNPGPRGSHLHTLTTPVNTLS